MSLETGVVTLIIYFTIFTVVGIWMNLDWKKTFGDKFYWQEEKSQGVLFFALVGGFAPVIYLLGSLLSF